MENMADITETFLRRYPYREIFTANVLFTARPEDKDKDKLRDRYEEGDVWEMNAQRVHDSVYVFARGRLYGYENIEQLWNISNVEIYTE